MPQNITVAIGHKGTAVQGQAHVVGKNIIGPEGDGPVVNLQTAGEGVVAGEGGSTGTCFRNAGNAGYGSGKSGVGVIATEGEVAATVTGA